MDWAQYEPLWRLLVVLVLLALGAWGVGQWLRRRPALVSANRQLRVVTAVAVGTRERVVLLEVEGEKVLIGVSPQGITPLWQKSFAQTLAEQKGASQRAEPREENSAEEQDHR